MTEILIINNTRLTKFHPLQIYTPWLRNLISGKLWLSGLFPAVRWPKAVPAQWVTILSHSKYARKATSLFRYIYYQLCALLSICIRRWSKSVQSGYGRGSVNRRSNPQNTTLQSFWVTYAKAFHRRPCLVLKCHFGTHLIAYFKLPVNIKKLHKETKIHPLNTNDTFHSQAATVRGF
jgi:hypothetical protein